MTNNFDKMYSTSVTISLGVITIFYTTIAGLPASIVTDKFQGVIMGLLVVILTIAVPTQDSVNLIYMLGICLPCDFHK
jgi:Na+/pantothenate symporter